MWRILSVGRDPLLLQTRQLLLEAFGCQVQTFTSLQEALAACAGAHFDAAVLCQTLTEAEIAQVREALRACAPELHIVRLRQQDDFSYDPIAFVQRVQRAASISAA